MLLVYWPQGGDEGGIRRSIGLDHTHQGFHRHRHEEGDTEQYLEDRYLVNEITDVNSDLGKSRMVIC